MLLLGPLAVLGASAALGAIGAAAQKKPKVWDRERAGVGADFTPERRGQFFTPTMDYIQRVATGQEIGLGQGEMTQLTSGAHARNRAAGRAQRAMAAERSLASGLGPRSAATQHSLSNLGRAQIGAGRDIDTGVLNYALQQRAADRDRALRAGQLGSSILQRDKALDARLALEQFASENARHQFGSTFRRAIMGAAAGAGQGLSGLSGGAAGV